MHMKVEPVALSQLRRATQRALLASAMQSMTPTEFESLCYFLVERNPRFRSVNYLGLKGHDSGVDIIAHSGPQDRMETWVFQCKKHDKYALDTFVAAIEKLRSNQIAFDVLVFFTSREVPSGIMRNAISRAGEMAVNSVEFWGPSRIAALLEDAPEVLRLVFRDENAVAAEVLTGLRDFERQSRSPAAQVLARAVTEGVRDGLKPAVGVGSAIALALLARSIEKILVSNSEALNRLEKR